ncbi:hypothetical protein [Atopomonas sediminilitoris]|uniref:hypothetical protein n=1 Tax=Atopomonas sediminilitoris TaxID=2919919 RepID=UPI001F4EC4B0|nr:hypothetical protein [Atopomonas sediminilitoris]MCJ8169500.1 hypothetical protein [Atopomonas sediminilitoris]
MPFTPLHLGPGLACKALLGRHFSVMVFGGTQVLMDIEPLIGILRGSSVLHGPSHTLLGALLIGLIAGLSGKPISSWVLQRLHIPHYPLSWRVAFASAWLGSFSHIALDAVMHSDMHPAWPLSLHNHWLHALPLDVLHGLCLGLGVLALPIIAWRCASSSRR